MPCKELNITDYFRLTDTTGTPNKPVSISPGTPKKSPRGFKPVVSVSIPNYRYYSPELGRWLSRDPIWERGGYNLYAFVVNNPNYWYDYLGRDLDNWLDMAGEVLGITSIPVIIYNAVTTNEEDANGVYGYPGPCPSPQSVRYIQIYQGGFGSYSGPSVDEGSSGFGGETSTGSALYPEGPSPGTFSDNPGAFAGPVEFEVCRVCVCPDGTIASIGPCARWKNGDSGDLDWDFDTPSINLYFTVEFSFPGTFDGVPVERFLPAIPTMPMF